MGRSPTLRGEPPTETSHSEASHLLQNCDFLGPKSALTHSQWLPVLLLMKDITHQLRYMNPCNNGRYSKTLHINRCSLDFRTINSIIPVAFRTMHVKLVGTCEARSPHNLTTPSHTNYEWNIYTYRWVMSKMHLYRLYTKKYKRVVYTRTHQGHGATDVASTKTTKTKTEKRRVTTQMHRGRVGLPGPAGSKDPEQILIRGLEVKGWCFRLLPLLLRPPWPQKQGSFEANPSKKRMSTHVVRW